MDLTKFHHLNMILLCGLYGSGKTEFALQHFKGKDRSRISRSEIRKFIFEMTNFGELWTPEKFNDENDALVKHMEKKMLEQYIHFKHNLLIVNTFVTKKSRQGFIDIARQNKKTIGAIFIQRPLEQCLERNGRNKIAVPQHVIYTLHAKIELPAKNEGFDEVLTVTYK